MYTVSEVSKIFMMRVKEVMNSLVSVQVAGDLFLHTDGDVAQRPGDLSVIRRLFKTGRECCEVA